MKLIICAVKDRALDGFMRPMFVPSVGMAVRAFQDEINRPDGELYKHPGDYDLYVLGDWDEATGAFDSGTPERVAVGKQLSSSGGV